MCVILRNNMVTVDGIKSFPDEQMRQVKLIVKEI